MRPLLFAATLPFLALTLPQAATAPPRSEPAEPDAARIVQAFGRQGIRINPAEATGIRPNVLLALQEARAHGIGNSKVDFAAVEIARDLGLDTSADTATVKNVVAALKDLLGAPAGRPLPPPASWDTYFEGTTNLTNQPRFLNLLKERGFHPVKISWEDIGRHEGSVWGDRISDVGIWVRKDERDPASARLALSVRRDSNFRDKVLMVPADKIKVHLKQGDRTVERSLPERLRELGLASPTRDRNVIVSNQFAIVPVPARDMRGAWPEGVPPRAAFTFSIFPYGSTNFVITDVIEGSSDAIVGPGSHQLLYANINGQKAPFTASRAEDRQDLLKLEQKLKAEGMDVDVQRYYLIQIPLKRDRGITLSNLGTPPMARVWGEPISVDYAGNNPTTYYKSAAAPPPPSPVIEEAAGLGKVAIGHGEAEGAYTVGANWQNTRADEPIRVTVVYFVTPKGPVTRKDMEAFSKAFQAWDQQAIWGGSFVTKESGM